MKKSEEKEETETRCGVRRGERRREEVKNGGREKGE